MDRLAYCASIVLVLGLLHYSYLDWRARAHGGVMGFWTAWDKPLLLRISNAAALAAFVAAFTSFALGVSQTLVIVVAALFIIHVVSHEMLSVLILPVVRCDPPERSTLPLLPPREVGSADVRGLDLSDRFWRNEVEGLWLTDFPPPAGFDGYQSSEWGSSKYERACTCEEVAIVEANRAAGISAERANDEALRDAWLDMLKKDLPNVSEPSQTQREIDVEPIRTAIDGRV